MGLILFKMSIEFTMTVPLIDHLYLIMSSVPGNLIKIKLLIYLFIKVTATEPEIAGLDLLHKTKYMKVWLTLIF